MNKKRLVINPAVAFGIAFAEWHELSTAIFCEFCGQVDPSHRYFAVSPVFHNLSGHT